MKPTIHILMATYQSEAYIIAQLESIMKQTYQDFQLIIRDDASTDQTLPFIEEFSQSYRGKIRLIKGKKNVGAKKNFALLMQEARSDYVMFSDGDDVWLSEKIAQSLFEMQKLEEKYGKKIPLLVHTDLAVVDRSLKILSPSFFNYSKLNPHTALSLNRLVTHNVVTGCTILMNRSLCDLASPIPAEAIMHDWWIALVAATFGQIGFVPHATILYRQHGKNDIGAKNWRSFKTYYSSIKKAFRLMGREELRTRLFKTFLQASAFVARYDLFLSEKQKRIFKHYLLLRNANACKKRYLLLRYRFFKNDFAKNVGMFFLV